MNEKQNRHSNSELYEKLTALEEEQQILREKTALMQAVVEDLAKARQEAEESEAKFRAIFETATDGILLADIETKHLYLPNNQICKMLGYTSQELEQMTIPDIHPAEDLPWILEAVKRQIRREISIAENVPLRRKDGSIFFADVNASVISLGENHYLAGIFRDITERLEAQKTLQQREAELTSIFRAAPVGIGVMINRILTKANERLCQMLGYTEEELLNQSARMLYPTQEDYECVGQEKYSQIREKGTSTVETRWIRKDGTIIDVLFSSAPFDVHDWSRGITFAARDITDRKRIANKLAQQQRELSSLFHSVPVGISQVKDRVFLRVNQIYCQSLGYTIEELIGKTTSLLYPTEEDFHRWGQFLYSRLRDKGEVTQEISLRHKDGHFVDFLLRGVYVDPQDPDKGQIFALTDITERKRAERALEFTQFAVEHISDSAFWMDSEGRFFYVNEAACKNLGYTREELLTMRVHDINPDQPPQVWPRHWQRLKTEGTRIFRSRHKTKDGRIFPIEIIDNFVEFGGKEYNCAFARDITERIAYENTREKLLKELRSKNEELESIVFIASHDLRSPLVNIEGFTGELKRACLEIRDLLGQEQCPKDIQKQLDHLLGEEIPESIGFISAGTAKMDTLLSGLLRLSRIGTATIHIEPVHMNLLLQTILGAMRFEIRRLDVEVAVEDLPDCIGDAVQIGQVFSNLIDNAIKYRHPERPARITIRGAAGDNEVVYAVADNGIGINPQHHDKIFEIFHQLNPAGKQRGEGLGLTIVRRILDRLDGRIWVESQADSGSTFYVSLPKAR